MKEPDAEVAGVRISHPGRIMYGDPGITKLELARYYESVGPWMLPHIIGRPLTLVHCPEGADRECRYLKHSKLWAFPGVRRVRIPEQKKVGDYLIVESIEGLIMMAQMDIVEIHTWNSTFDHLEQPDRLVFDIDPGPEVPARQVIQAARLVRSLLRAVKLECFVKTTGGAGLHVVVPIQRKSSWQQCLEFARTLAAGMARQDPSLYTVTFAKAGRQRKILIDYLRNNRGNTSVGAFSTRAHPGAPVSVPLSWEELTEDRLENPFTVRSVLPRLKRLKADPWGAYRATRQRLPAVPEDSP